MIDCDSDFDNLILDDDSNNNSFISKDDEFEKFKREYEIIFKYNNDNYCDYKKIEENQTKIETQHSTNNENNNNIENNNNNENNNNFENNYNNENNNNIENNNNKENNNNNENNNENNNNIDNNNENNNNNNNKKKQKIKPGRKTNKNILKKKIHDKNEGGNINSKIKNFFINKKIIEHLNKKIFEFFGRQRNLLRKIKYECNNICNKNKNRKFLNKKLKEFLCENEISKKYKHIDSYQNKINLEKLEKYKNFNSYSNNKDEPNFYECLEMTIETFYKEIFLKKYLDEFVEENIKKENDENYIQKLKTKAENFIEYYKNEENENKNYLSKKRKNKSIFVINYDN